MDAGLHEEPRKGAVRLDVSLQYIDQDRPRAGVHPAAVGQVPNAEHNEIRTINRVWNVRADYDIDARWGASLQLPIIARSHDHLSVDDGSNEHWSFTGAGDLIALVRYAVITKKDETGPSVLLTASVKFPTGRTSARNEKERAEVSIQPGTGSFDFTGGAIYSQNAAKLPNLQGHYSWLPLFVSGSYRVNNPGSRRYRMGDQVQANAGGSFAILDRLDLLAQANLLVKLRDDNGDTGEDTSFTGGTFAYLSPGLRWHLTKGLSTYGLVQLPVYQYVSQEQINSAWNLVVGATFEF